MVLGAAMYLVAFSAKKRIEKAREALSAQDVETFNERYRSRANRANRADMPAKFNAYAQATGGADRIWIISAVALIMALLAILYLGSDLGLTTGDTP